MIDFLRFPIFVTWYITSVCNLRCKHCYLTNYKSEPELSIILNIIEYLKIKGVNHISFVGGEPLSRNDLEIIIKKCSDLDIETKIATNGILATEERAKSLFVNGCSKFQVSLEGYSPESSDPIRGNGTFYKIVEGIDNLKKTGSFVSLAFTISKQNKCDIKNIYTFAKEIGIDQLKLAPFMPIGSGKINQDKFILNRSDIIEIRKSLLDISKQTNKLQIKSIFIPTIENPDDINMSCGAGTYNLVINSDLTLSACDLLVEEDKTITSIRNVEDIEYLWLNSPIFQKWRGKVSGNTISIRSFDDINKKGCHVANETYKEDIFR